MVFRIRVVRYTKTTDRKYFGRHHKKNKRTRKKFQTGRQTNIGDFYFVPGQLTIFFSDLKLFSGKKIKAFTFLFADKNF